MKFLNESKLLFVSFFVFLYVFRVQITLILGISVLLCLGLFGLNKLAMNDHISAHIQRGYSIVSTRPSKSDPTRTIFTLIKDDEVVYCEGYKIPNTDRISDSVCSFSETTDSYNLGSS